MGEGRFLGLFGRKKNDDKKPKADQLQSKSELENLETDLKQAKSQLTGEKEKNTHVSEQERALLREILKKKEKGIDHLSADADLLRQILERKHSTRMAKWAVEGLVYSASVPTTIGIRYLMSFLLVNIPELKDFAGTISGFLAGAGVQGLKEIVDYKKHSKAGSRWAREAGLTGDLGQMTEPELRKSFGILMNAIRERQVDIDEKSVFDLQKTLQSVQAELRRKIEARLLRSEKKKVERGGSYSQVMTVLAIKNEVESEMSQEILGITEKAHRKDYEAVLDRMQKIHWADLGPMLGRMIGRGTIVAAGTFLLEASVDEAQAQTPSIKDPHPQLTQKEVDGNIEHQQHANVAALHNDQPDQYHHVGDGKNFPPDTEADKDIKLVPDSSGIVKITPEDKQNLDADISKPTIAAKYIQINAHEGTIDQNHAQEVVNDPNAHEWGHGLHKDDLAEVDKLADAGKIHELSEMLTEHDIDPKELASDPKLVKELGELTPASQQAALSHTDILREEIGTRLAEQNLGAQSALPATNTEMASAAAVQQHVDGMKTNLVAESAGIDATGMAGARLAGMKIYRDKDEGAGGNTNHRNEVGQAEKFRAVLENLEHFYSNSQYDEYIKLAHENLNLITSSTSSFMVAKVIRKLFSLNQEGDALFILENAKKLPNHVYESPANYYIDQDDYAKARKYYDLLTDESNQSKILTAFDLMQIAPELEKQRLIEDIKNFDLDHVYYLFDKVAEVIFFLKDKSRLEEFVLIMEGKLVKEERDQVKANIFWALTFSLTRLGKAGEAKTYFEKLKEIVASSNAYMNVDEKYLLDSSEALVDQPVAGDSSIPSQSDFTGSFQGPAAIGRDEAVIPSVNSAAEQRIEAAAPLPPAIKYFMHLASEVFRRGIVWQPAAHYNNKANIESMVIVQQKGDQVFVEINYSDGKPATKNRVDVHKLAKNFLPAERQGNWEELVSNENFQAVIQNMIDGVAVSAPKSMSIINRESAPAPIPETEQREKEIKRKYLRYLAYQDANLDVIDDPNFRAFVQDQMDHPRMHPSAPKYVEAMEEIIALYGEDKFEQLAQTLFSNLQAKYAELSDKLNLGNQNYSLTSKSWAYWDIAKQFYLFTHSSESSPTYRLANPMEDLQVRAEIIDRMLGWDIFGKRETLLNNWLSTARNLKPEGASEIFKILSSGKKVLSSAELSHLGKLVLDSLK